MSLLEKIIQTIAMPYFSLARCSDRAEAIIR